ncbi:NAD-dependent epimerase/dehydratase family protein [Streptomyces sp. NBC_01754]|uniref:NAD-dependent epimerase/dehydratase family protein n=1 Tax=Streptomyces sp. NBC_01754 TaxID=2975930 RepID=UPI002DD94008|nr:NAD-dependent epimerase/dehydratase family protein [Streptomyces sp. NBC_01754]WSC90921.1 NAD-dependent epimerase/dehydratase family protein [Streptomyces sp. NBC_01754]WSC96585.1 NAD-dependent epimerase/dehydratase family protein [Streptomyces sp. NBC_01754]
MSGHTPRRVLVTGGSGFLGHHLVERLRDRGDEVTVFDVSAPRRAACAGVRFVEGDLRDEAALEGAGRGAEVVYHLAAVVGVDQYLARPLDVVDINFSGTRNVLGVAARAGAKVVLASTSEVFGKNPAVPWREDGDRVLGPTTSDRWSYSSSKALAEHLTFAFARRHGLDATVVRYFNVYGPRQRPAYVVSRSVHRALNGRPLVVYDGGRQTRCFTFVDDAVTGTIRAADEPAASGEVFNIGSMAETSVGTVVGLVAELTGTTSVVDVDTTAALGESYEDLGRRVPDNAKAARVLGWRPETSLRDGLVRTIEWARASDWWLALPDSGAG